MRTRAWVVGIAALALLPSCSSVKYYLGFGTGDEDDKNKAEVIDRPDPEEYILVKNPKYSPAGGPGIGVPEPEFIWVKRKDAPFTVDAFIRRKQAAEADPREEAKYASTRPPEAVRPPRPDERFFIAPDEVRPAPRKAAPEPPRARPAPARPADPMAALRPVYGYVVHVKGKQIYTDLAEESGIAVGNTVIIFREGEELKHPVTGAPLGRADEEVGRARILEVGDRTSVAEVVSLKDGEQVHPKDKVKLLRAN